MHSFRQRALWCVLSLCASVFWAAPARAELIEADAAWPSVGPGSDRSRAQSQWVDVEIDHTGESVLQPRSPVDVIDGPLTPAATLSFDGIDETLNAPDCCTQKPPDTHMAVGTGTGAAGRVVMVTNAGIQLWDKTGASLAGPTPLVSFLGVTNPCPAHCPDPFDPKVLFDQHSGRFFVVVLAGTTPNPGGKSNIHIAVSTTSTPDNLGAAWVKMSGSALTTVGAVNTWCDYPSIGADASALFVTCNLFDASETLHGVKIRVFDKSAATGLLAGIYSFVDINVDAAVTTGIFTVQPAHVYGATDSGHFYLINRFGSAAYRLWEISGAPAAPVIVGNATRAWTAGTQISGGGAPQMGSAITIDTLSARTMNAVYRNGFVWTTLTSDMDADSKTEVFWAKIATNGGIGVAPPSVADSGFIDGSDGDEWTFMPSINVNAGNDATIVYSQSFSDQFPEIRYASRASGDPAGTFQTSVVPPGGTSPGFYDDFGTDNPERWGDFAATVVDPADDTTFWIAQEVVKTSGVNTSAWKTRIVKLGAVGKTPTPTPTKTPTPTPTKTPTPTSTSPTATPTPTLTATPTRTATPTPTLTATPTPTVTPTPSRIIDPVAAKAADKCAKAITKAGSTFVASKLKSLDKCANGILKCVQTVPDEPARQACIDKAGATCTAQLAKIDVVAGKLKDGLAKRCGVPMVSGDTMRSGAGLGYSQLVTECQSPLDDIGMIGDCLIGQHDCQAKMLFEVEEPRAGELLALAHVDLGPMPCLDNFGGGGDVGDPKTLGKAVVQCEAAIKKAAAKLASAKLKSLKKCVGAVFTCVQTKPDPSDPSGAVPCLTLPKAKDTCIKEFAKIDVEKAKLDAAIDKKCVAAGIDLYAVLSQPNGARLGAPATECALFGVPSLDTYAHYKQCLFQQHTCRAAEVLRFEAPRAAELLERLEDPSLVLRSDFCPVPAGG